MNLRERLLDTLRGRPADRVPLMLDGFLFGRRDELETIGDPLQRDIAERAFSRCAGFVSWPSHINRYLVTPPQFIRKVSREERDGVTTTRSEIPTPKGTLTAITSQNPSSRTTWTVKYPVETRRDIDRMLSLPWELPRALRPPERSRFPAQEDGRTLSRIEVSSPFVCAAGMMPYQYFLELCADDLPLVKHLTEVCFERIMRILDVLLVGRGVIDYVWMGGCEWVTPPMASAKIYDALVQDYEARIIERVHEHGAVVHVHCHGNVRTTIERVIERGADFFEPVEPPPDGDITMAEAKRAAAGRTTLGGNIEARLIENEDADAVEAAVRAAFEGGTERMILKPTEGLIRPMTPRMAENYRRIIEVWEALSSVE